MDGIFVKAGFHSSVIPVSGGLEVRAAASHSPLSSSKQVASQAVIQRRPAISFGFLFMSPLKSLWRLRPAGRRSNGNVLGDAVLEETCPIAVESLATPSVEDRNENWVLKIVRIRSLWKDGRIGGDRLDIDGGDVSVNIKQDEHEDETGETNDYDCESCRVYDDAEEMMEFDQHSFAKLLKKVSLSEAKLYSRLSYLGNLAYCIPKMKAGNWLARRGFDFVTSSVDKRGPVDKSDVNEVLPVDHEYDCEDQEEEAEGSQDGDDGYRISALTAYNAVASAASYLQSRATGIFPVSSNSESQNRSAEREEGVNGFGGMSDPEMASLMATTDSVTAVVAAKEEVKQAVADDLNSTQSSPCEWFICDDDKRTRYFVIQGSESLASWKANLLFEPVKFEGFDVPVHRGIYEAAKGMYEQMLPEVREHLASHGKNATFRFTGHSLGGSLSLLLNLMLLIRGEVPVASLLPVITFGAPSVMCGGDDLLRKLGLPPSHVQAITLHRDIVPRAFSCNYPNHVAEFLKAVNGSFRKHPCLNNQKLLYAPMGQLLILQPDENFSPHHHLLPEGSGFYVLTCEMESYRSEQQLRAAQTVFFNSPHPLEILSDRCAYGSGGTIQRDHDMNSYLRCVRHVVRQERNRLRKAKRESRKKFWLSILAPYSDIGGKIALGQPMSRISMGQKQATFSGVLQAGRESMKRLSRFVTSQHTHMLLILMLPARLLLLEAYSFISIS